MNILYRLLKQDKNNREGAIVVTSALGVLVNVLIAILKMIIGLLANSVAILSEGANNASDALTSIMALLGAKLASMHPTKKHPFGYGRIEYLTSLVISTLILVTGIKFIQESIEHIIRPKDLQVSYLSLIIVAITAVIKYALGTYTINTGKRVDSNSLIGVGSECRSDSIASLITIISSFIFLIFGYNLDGYAGIVVSALIIKAGGESLGDTISDLLGESGNKELALKVYKEIRDCDIVYNAADMKLHNYGPDRYSGTCNVEIAHNISIEEAYYHLHELQLNIMHKYNIVMVFGIYAVDYKSKDSIKMRSEIADFIKKHEHVLSYHALYVNEKEMKLYVDLTVDYELKDWEALKVEFTDYMKELYPQYKLALTVETDFV